MESRKLDELERDRDDSDQHSSSECCSNISFAETRTGKCEGSAVSSRAKRKGRRPSGRRSGFGIGEENTRDENMRRKFGELCSVVPGLNMKDEDLMLDDAISYLKLLQLRANILDEQKKNLRVEKAWVFGDNDIGESSSSVYLSTRALPEIKAKVQGKDVLIRVHCENKNGYLTKVLREIEKLQLVVENISSLPFGDYFLDIAVTAKMSDESFTTTMDLKTKLREALQLLM